MTIIVKQAIDNRLKEAIFDLWNQEYPSVIQLASLPDLDLYLERLRSLYHLFLMDDQDKVAGWLFLFEREGETWFAMILDRKVQGQGYGSRLLAKAGTLTEVLNGWAIDRAEYYKADGSAYPSPLAFYRKMDFKVLEERLEQPFASVKVRWKRNKT